MSETTQTPDDDVEIVHVDDAPAAETIPAPVAASPTVDEGLDDLKRQLAATETARQQAEDRANQSDARAVQFQNEGQRANYDAISRALEAQQAEVERVQARLQGAYENGDFAAAAKAQTDLNKASIRHTQLEDGKAQMEHRLRNPAQQPQPQRNEADAQLAGMSTRTQAWLKAHPDAMSDPKRQNQVRAAHFAALAADHTPDSDAYFDFVEQHAGYKTAPGAQAPAQRQRTAQAATPVSGTARAPSGGSATPTTIRMSQKMRDAARTSGITEEKYARQVAKMVASGEMQYVNGEYVSVN